MLKQNIVPINDTVYETLKSLQNRRSGDLIFPGKNGSCLVDIRHSFATAIRNARIEHFRFHDLRHTFASKLVMVGTNIRAVQELLGHKDIRMTMRYSHLSNSYLKEAVKRLDNDTQMALESGPQNQCPANPSKISQRPESNW